MRTIAATLLLTAAALVPSDARCDDPAPLATPQQLERLARIGQDLARRGRRAESEETLSVFADLRAAPKDVEAQRTAATKLVAKAKDAGLPQADVAKALARLAADIAGGLAASEGDAKEALARQVLRLDALNREAHVALGDEEVGGRYVPKAVVPCLARRTAIQDAINKARRLEVKFTEEESPIDLLERLYGKRGRCLRAGDVAAHSVEFPPQQVEREMREVLRTMALSNWLLTGTLEVPKMPQPLDLVFLRKREVYQASLKDALEHGEIDASQAKAAQAWDGYVGTTHRLFAARGESEIRVHGFFHACEFEDRAHPGDLQVALHAGHLNWLYSNFLGVPMPGVGVIDPAKVTTKNDGGTHDTPAEVEKTAEMIRLARAGLQGSRRYMRWLAHRGEDPAWSHSMVPDLDKLGPNDLLKSTVVVDYLVETGEFAKLLEDTRGKPAAAATFEPLLPGGLGAFEARWREWLFSDEPPSGLVQRLATAPAAAMTADEAAVVRYLDVLRRSTLGATAKGLGVDRDLSDGCRAHALYLTKHPKQCTAWPDAHEEYPGEEGFSPAGSRAGLSSVINFGITRPEDSIDGWMGTFYHRLPLLDAGLMRIGWGLEKGVAVLDAGSLVAPPDDVGYVVWPPANAKDVPRRFSPEMPSPVPGEDQGAWGYPITLQYRGLPEDPDIVLKLYAGAKRGGTELACHFSSPHHPTNPLCVPEWSYCLIPKQTLGAGATYTVVASGMPKAAEFVWSFTTSSK